MNAFQAAVGVEESRFIRHGATLRLDLENLLAHPNDNITVYPYQIQAVLNVGQMLAQDQGPQVQPSLIVAPTGSGKSGMITLLPYVLQSRKVLIITPSSIISDQLAVAFGSRSEREGCFFRVTNMCNNAEQLDAILEIPTVIKTSREAAENAMGNLVIVNAHKFQGRAAATLALQYRNHDLFPNVREFFSQFDTLIVDEAHHYPTTTWRQIVEQFSMPRVGLRKKLIFVTATPYTRDGGIVVPDDRIAYVVTQPMCEGLATRPRNLDIRDDERLYAQDITNILAQHQQLEPRFVPQAMVLVTNTTQAREVAGEINQFMNDQRYAVAISGPTAIIKNGLENFTAGNHRVAVTVKVAVEGYDNTNVTLCAVLKSVGTGRITFEQFLGRCMRIKRNLGGNDGADRTIATILSYREYDIEEDYNNLNQFAEVDPESDDEEEVE